MSIQNNFPAIRPSLLLDFAKAQVLDPRVTFARASTATFTNSLGLIQTAASGVPRFDFNPLTDECNGLLIEEQRTNLATNSEEVTGTVNVAVTRNAIAAPDGLATADLVLDNTTNSEHYADKTVAVTSGVTHTYSAFIAPYAAAQIPVVFLRVAASAGSGIVAYTFATGVLSTSGSLVAFGSQVFPNGWIRIWVTVLATSSGTGVFRVQLAQDITTAPYIGTGRGCYVWGQQVEVGAFPTSYIPTVASQVTRAADNASMTGTNFSSWYNAAEGTIYGEYTGVANVSGATRRLVEIGIEATTNNRFVVGYSQTNNTSFLVVAGGVSQADITGSATQGSVVKFAGAYALNNIQQATNATLGTADTSATIPLGINAMVIGADFGPTANTVLNGTIRKIAYYPICCTNAQLQALTS